MHGMLIINEMSREELVEEILATQRTYLMEKHSDELKVIIIGYRLQAARERLEAEAQFENPPGGGCSFMQVMGE